MKEHVVNWRGCRRMNVRPIYLKKFGHRRMGRRFCVAWWNIIVRDILVITVALLSYMMN